MRSINAVSSPRHYCVRRVCACLHAILFLAICSLHFPTDQERVVICRFYTPRPKGFTVLYNWIVPVDAHSCRLITHTVDTQPLPGFVKWLVALRPRWFDHLVLSAVFDGDLVCILLGHGTGCISGLLRAFVWPLSTAGEHHVHYAKLTQSAFHADKAHVLLLMISVALLALVGFAHASAFSAISGSCFHNSDK